MHREVIDYANKTYAYALGLPDNMMANFKHHGMILNTFNLPTTKDFFRNYSVNTFKNSPIDHLMKLEVCKGSFKLVGESHTNRYKFTEKGREKFLALLAIENL